MFKIKNKIFSIISLAIQIIFSSLSHATFPPTSKAGFYVGIQPCTTGWLKEFTGIVAFLQLLDEVMGIGFVCCFLDLLQ